MSTYKVMQGQAGSRIIGSFRLQRDGSKYASKLTSHYANREEFQNRIDEELAEGNTVTEITVNGVEVAKNLFINMEA